MNKSIYDIWLENPAQALATAFDREAAKNPYKKDSIFVWVSVAGDDGVRYGKYRRVSKEELASRVYEIEISDYNISIFFTDAIHVYIPGRGKVTIPMTEYMVIRNEMLSTNEHLV